MATNNKPAAKPSKSAKTVSADKSVANKQVPVKAIANKSAAPAKKAVAAKSAEPTVAAKKAAAPAKKAVVAPQAKTEPAKKADSTTKTNNHQTVNKTNSKAEVPVKKAPIVKKAEAPVKEVAVKKEAPAAKKAVVAKPVEKAPAKPAVKAAPQPKEKAAPAPVAKKAPAPAPKAAEEPVVTVTVKKAVPAKKKLTVTQMPVKINPAAPRPMATPAARSVEKKPTVVVAHRRLENKSKGPKEVENTMIQYQPETYRSILDEPQQQHGPIYRYSDEDLSEFREIIVSRLDAARKELNYLQGLITRKDEAGTEDTENRYMNMEDGSGAMEREQLAQLASRQIQFMGHLEKALVRIENKTYGICRVTGKLIDKARLRAVPHATLSIEAKKMMSGK